MSQQQQEIPLPKDELNARIDALWREELEWLRQHPEPDLAVFNAEFDKEVNQKSLSRRIVRELPPLNIAMWSRDISFHIDVSDPEKFNNRFIELPAGHTGSSTPLLIGIHHIILLLVLAITIAMGSLELAPLYAIAMVFLAPLMYFSIASDKTTSGRIRYNRQAQLIHIDDGQGHVAHIPWRYVRPVVDYRYANMSMLKLYAPRPRAEQEIYKLRTRGNPSPPPIDFTGPYCCGSGFSGPLYELQGLEFVRRYMEQGIRAIQPTYPPENEQTRPAANRPVPVLSLIKKCWRILCLSSRFEQLARHAEDRFEWNDDVKNLCGPAPDLRGLDTRPVKSDARKCYRPVYGLPGVGFVYQMGDRNHFMARGSGDPWGK